MLPRDSNIPKIYRQIANFTHWKRCPYWNLIESHCLLFGIEPSIEAQIEPGKFLEHAGEYEELEGLILINGLLIRAIEAGDLKPDINPHYPPVNRWEYKFRPKTIVICAYNLKIAIPEALEDLIQTECLVTSNDYELLSNVKADLNPEDPYYHEEVELILKARWAHFRNKDYLKEKSKLSNPQYKSDIETWLIEHDKKNKIKREQASFDRITKAANPKKTGGAQSTSKKTENNR